MFEKCEDKLKEAGHGHCVVHLNGTTKSSFNADYKNIFLMTNVPKTSNLKEIVFILFLAISLFR